MKILYVLPHCSTGGMPQYVLKLIEETTKEHHIEVVEVNNVSDDYVVQRNKIKEIVPFHQLFGNQQVILELVQEFDVIHFQEIPETFIDISVLNKLYRKGRKHDIVVTTHSSYTDPTAIRFTADRFVLVSQWSKKRFEQVFPGICEMWEYPIEIINYNKEQAKEHLGWDKSYKHVLHVGLFTPGKNQKELIEIAKLCTSEKIIFHFVGNQASNFEDYWGPLMKDLPSNCIIHGEVNNPEDYYKASDLFYFPSLFELNPLAVKEALSFGLFVMLRKLDTYEDMYDNKVQYITDDILSNRRILLNELGVFGRIQIIHLLTDSDDKRQYKSIEQLSKLSEYGFVYTQHVNKIYDGIPPSDFCRRPQHINQNPEHIKNGYGYLTGRHYGCFLAHIDAIKSIDEKQFDYTLIFEADAYIKGDISDFVNIILEACNISEKENIQYISFGNNPSPSKLKYNNDFSETAIQQDLAHSYLLPSRYKTWYINAIETVPWDGFDIWFNEVFYRNGGKRFTTNKELCIQLPGISLIDCVSKWDVDEFLKPVLIISSGRRWEYFKKTIEILVEKNPDILNVVKKIWVLDDRSSTGERTNMEILLNRLFDSKWNMMCFNSEEPFEFVEKFRMIKSLVEPSDIVFLLEDDWECFSSLNLTDHCNFLKNTDYTQIAFADPFWIQTEDIKSKCYINESYWKNPWPENFRHAVKWQDGLCHWTEGSINNYTNNPSLIKGEIFFKANFTKHKNFEASFADEVGGNQVFTQEALFGHIGEKSLINQL